MDENEILAIHNLTVVEVEHGGDVDNALEEFSNAGVSVTSYTPSYHKEVLYVSCKGNRDQWKNLMESEVMIDYWPRHLKTWLEEK